MGKQTSPQRDAALALLNGNYRHSPKAGRFLGQIAVEGKPLTPKQADWMEGLLEKAKLPALAEWPAQ